MDSYSLDLGHVTEDFAVAPQLTLRDLEPLRATGYRSILIIRPDGEARAQPNHMQISDAAREVGIEARFLPVRHIDLGPGHVTAFRRNFDALPKPLVAYSGGGRRAITLWALAMVGRIPAAEIIERALRAGHNLSELGPVLDP